LNDIWDKINQAFALKKEEKFEDALEILYTLHLNDSASDEIKNALIEVLFEYGSYLNDDWVEDFERAADCFTKIIELDAQNYRAWYNLGISYFRLRETTKSLEAYEQALKIKPDYEYIYYNIGLLHEILNEDYEKAAKYYEKALGLNDNFTYALQALRDVRKKIEHTKLGNEKTTSSTLESQTICKECGNINRSTAKYCDKCGNPIL
jgi:tetratricopeptide (TPR) repeat protein